MALLFLSHSSSDAALATELCERLESQGVTCFIAPRDLTPGRPYPDQCVRGIESSDALVLLATSAGVSSVQVLSEVEQAHKRGKPIFTVMVGRPNVSRELDFYISRLHWIQAVPGSLEPVAAALIDASRGTRHWNDLATGPSLLRRLRHRRDLFIAAASAALFVTLAVAGGVVYFLGRAQDALDRDYRRLGFVEVTLHDTPAREGADRTADLQVWLIAPAVSFADVTLMTRTVRADGTTVAMNHSSALRPSDAGRMQFVSVPLPRNAQAFTSCLVVPSAALGGRYRVSQTFGPDARPLSEATVSQDDGRPCGEP